MLNITQDLPLNKILVFTFLYSSCFNRCSCYQGWTRYNLFVVVVVLYIRCLSRKLSLNSIIFLKNQLNSFHLKYFSLFYLINATQQLFKK